MPKQYLAFAASLTLASAAAAAQPIVSPTPPPPPKLMILLSIDQLSSDLFEMYRGQFTRGLAKLAGGTVFRNGYQSHANTETCPGHAALSTGTHPARNGIIANDWVDFAAPRTDKKVYCVEDERSPGSDNDHYTVSLVHLNVPTLADRLKAQSPSSRVVALSQKDRSAALLAGRRPDAAYYWRDTAFVPLFGGPSHASVGAVNRAVSARIAEGTDAMEPPPSCAARATPIAIPEHAPVGAGAFARAPGDFRGWRNSPDADEAVLALGAGLVRDMALGRGPQTDLLALGLSSTDYVGHAYGNRGQEMCLQLLALDGYLGNFFDRLDSWGIDYAVAVSADHGAADIPERARLAGDATAARIDPDLTPAKVSQKVRGTTGLGGPIMADMFVTSDLYLDPSLTGTDRTRALEAVLAEYRRHPQVEAAFAKATIAATAMPTGDPSRWTLIERIRASFDPRRSGDVYVALKPGITPIGHARNSVATHGSPWDYDRRVPIIFWRKGGSSTTLETVAEVVDIAPTIAAMIGVSIPAGEIDGHCLGGAAGVVCPTQ